MRSTSILRKLESLDYVVEGKVIYPTLFMEWGDVEQVIHEHVECHTVNFKSVPLPRRRHHA